MTRPSETALRDSLRYLSAGCIYCGKPVTQLLVPQPSSTRYEGACAEACRDTWESIHALPLADMLEALGVTP